MELRRLGRVFGPDGTSEWCRSHASTPFGYAIGSDLLRVFFTSRDSSNRSHIGVVDIARTKRGLVTASAPRLVLSPGSVGLFDEDGVAMGSLVVIDGVEYLYYMGWSLRRSVPWQNTIGLAVREGDDPNFRKAGRVPVLDRSEEDPYSLSYPWVRRFGDQFVAWYGTNLSWGSTPGEMEHVIRRAVSLDGRSWIRDVEIAVDVERPDEYALSRPSVHLVSAGYEMFLSTRTRGNPDGYHLALACSIDGRSWRRGDEQLDFVGERADWESSMTCYPCVVDLEDEVLVLYCGDGYGAAGFGAAIMSR